MLFLVNFGDGASKSLHSHHNLHEQVFLKCFQPLCFYLSNINNECVNLLLLLGGQRRHLHIFLLIGLSLLRIALINVLNVDVLQ